MRNALPQGGRIKGTSDDPINNTKKELIIQTVVGKMGLAEMFSVLKDKR